MTNRTSPADDLAAREWEALSAYLDEQLNPKERAILESRLEDNPNLRSALEDLRRTRTLLRSQLKVRAPRNFTLTPEMAGLRPGIRPLPGAYPLLRLASVLATIFFVLVFVGDLATRMAQPEFRKMITAEVEEMEAPLVPSFGVGSGSVPATEAPVLSVEKEALTPPMQQPIAESPAQPTQVMMEKAEEEESLATSEASMVIVTPLGLSATPSPPIASEFADHVVTVTEEAPRPEGEVSPTRTMRELTAVVWGWSFLKALQVLLALLAVGTGLAAIYLRRSGRD